MLLDRYRSDDCETNHLFLILSWLSVQASPCACLKKVFSY